MRSVCRAIIRSSSVGMTQTSAALESVLRLPDSDWRRMSDAAYRQARSHSWDDAAAAFEAALRRRIEAATS